MMKNLPLIILGAAVISFLLLFKRPLWWVYPSPQADTDSESTNKELVVELNEVNDSKQSGQARLAEVDGRLVVRFSLSNAPKDVIQPNFIYRGTCTNIEKVGKVKYYLVPAVNGKSTATYYYLGLSDLFGDLPLSISVKKSLTEDVIVSCGTILDVFNKHV